MLDAAITLAIEILFALVFLASLVGYLHRRDAVSFDLVLIFGTVGTLFIVQLVGIILGSTPAWLAAGSALLILSQPLFTLRLAARLRPIPRAVVIAALIGYLATAIPLLLLPRPISIVLTLAAVGVFAVTEIVAAGYLALESRRRTGAARFRLGLASSATALFALALLTLGAGAAAGSQSSSQAVGRIVALLAAIGYALAFLPPGPLRRVWQGMAAYRYGLALVGEQHGAETDRRIAVWTRVAESAREIAGAEAAAVVGLTNGECDLWASVGLPPTPAPRSWTRQAFEALISGPASTIERPIEATTEITRELGGRIDARLASVVPLPTGRSALVLLARHRSLFNLEDRALIELLATQAVALAEREELYAEQALLAQRLFAASQAKSDFIASMSHELRTPLSAILGFSELMQTEPQQGDSRVVPAEWIEHVHRGGQHLLALINDVLDLAKVEAGRLELEPTTFDLRDLVTETAAGLRPLADRKRLVITSDISVGSFYGDRGRVRQILYNLLSNAIKFTPEQGAIAIEGAEDAGVVRLSVADSGPGIAPEDQALIFDEFRQVGDQGARQQGTGLGLALARRLAEAHGGTVEVVSQLGAGSRFTVVFPQQNALAGAREPTPEPAAAAPPAVLRPGRDILIVEDDPSTVQLLRTYLESDGFGVRIARDGAAGLAEARSRPPAAIVLDILLPGSDGWEVLREFKADPLLRDVPVIIVTVVDERELGLALGAVDYFLKPVDRTAILTRLAGYRFAKRDDGPMARILTVDDDPAALDLLDTILGSEGFDVVRADGGRQAIERARSQPFDLVICDLIMPDLDGFDVVTALKSDAATQDVPILILTAHTLSDADKVRLNGQILGIVDKGADAAAGLHRWLQHFLPDEDARQSATA